ncbi:hypothetical protein FRC04_010673 [Tulasnella sp. 424]|nr:hypothetical protein FRC04_010673 [Tulasnella sp. 424]KAG8972397.1 hypothetical protein FRC05_010108 [Tulasnella sp. 425]
MLHSVTFALTTFLAATLTGAVPAPAPQTSAIPPICQVIPLGSPAVATSGPPSQPAGLELTNSAFLTTNNGSALLTTNGYKQTWKFTNGGFGAFDACRYYWLNIGNSTSVLKPLSWSLTQVSTNWIAGYGQNLTAAATPYYFQTDRFVACKLLQTPQVATSSGPVPTPVSSNATTPTSSTGSGPVTTAYPVANKWALYLQTGLGGYPSETDDGAQIVECVETKIYIEPLPYASTA